jgi:hypothetical protein
VVLGLDAPDHHHRGSQVSVHTSTWVWYDPNDRYVLGSSSPTNFSRSVQNGPGVRLAGYTEDAFWTNVNDDDRIDDRDA